METKVCNNCKIQHNKSKFNKDKSKKDGLSTQCKDCIKIKKTLYREKNKEKIRSADKNYRDKNRDRIKIKHRASNIKYKNKHPDRVREINKKYYRNNKEKYSTYYKQRYIDDIKDSRINNKNIIALKRRENYKQKRLDPLFKIKCNLRSRLYATVAKGYKSTSTAELLGCDINFFKKFIEEQFTEEMNWNNYGKVWHLDHILPCNSYNLIDPLQQRICFNYTNLRPMIAAENIRKSDKIDVTDIIYGGVLVKLFKEDVEV